MCITPRAPCSLEVEITPIAATLQEASAAKLSFQAEGAANHDVGDGSAAEAAAVRHGAEVWIIHVMSRSRPLARLLGHFIARVLAAVVAVYGALLTLDRHSGIG